MPSGVTLLSPLAARDDEGGALVINTEQPLSRDELESLQSLATHISLALESAALTEDLHRRKSETRFRSLVAHASDLITVLDADGVVNYQSPSIERVLGYTGSRRPKGRRFDRLLAEGDRPRLAQILDGHTDGLETIAIECSLRHADGRWLQFEVHSTDLLEDEHVGGLVLNSRDISERKAFEEQLAPSGVPRPGSPDLPNRALFADRVGHALRPHAPQAVHDARRHVHRPGRLQDGQRQPRPRTPATTVLVEVARRLKTCRARPSDTVARFGGDEFADPAR